jgi:arylsulfatase A-like enzyme
MPQPDVLMLLCDTARADAFRPWGGPLPSPTVERLCREGLMFRRAYTAAPWTLPSTASIFSGLLPTEHQITAEWVKPKAGSAPESDLPMVEGAVDEPSGGATSAADDLPWLPDSLRRRGYRTWAASCNPWIASWMGFDRGFDEFVNIQPWGEGGRSRTASRLRRLREVAGRLDHGGREAFRSFASWLAKGDGDPWFAFVNLMELHDPYDPPLEFHPLRSTGPAGLSIAEAPRALLQQLRQRRLRGRPSASFVRTIRSLYYAAGRYEDQLVARFIRAVEDRERPAIVVMLSDHGENLGDHGLFEHHSSLHQTLLHVPLVVWGVGVDIPQGSVDEPVSLLGLRQWLEGLVDGRDGAMRWEGPIVSEYESTVERPQVLRREVQRWIDAGHEERVPVLYRHPGVAVRDGRHKYVAVADGTESLFDLDADPQERSDIAERQPEQVSTMRGHAEEWRQRRARKGRVAEARSEDAEIEEHLRMLGYVE